MEEKNGRGGEGTNEHIFSTRTLKKNKKKKPHLKYSYGQNSKEMVMPESHSAVNSHVTAAPAVCQTVHPQAA